MNNYCESNELKHELKCRNNNKELIDLILNELITIEIKSLDLSFNKLDNINIEIKSIIKLNLSNNRLLILKENQFSKLNKLEILDLSYNELFYIELNAFYGLNNVLQVLYLQNNHLTELYQNNLDNLQQLKYINFDSNKINKIRNNVFTSMTNLQNISFQYNRLETIEAEAFKGLKNLQDLSFNRNKLTSFDHVILESQLENLNLSFNKFTSFIVNENAINSAITIDLSSNNLDYFTDLTNLDANKNLILNNNKIKELNTNSPLNSLSLDSNHIVEITSKTFENFVRQF